MSQIGSQNETAIIRYAAISGHVAYMSATSSFRYKRQDTHRVIKCQGNRKEDDRCEYYNPTFPHTQQLFPDWHR